ncbi:MAG TPA: AMP-binding protein, partial [Afipia sp.]
MKQAIATGVAMESRPRPMTDLFDATVVAHPDWPALDFMGRVTTYAELADAVRHVAAGLQELGVREGTRVALCMPNMPHYPILFLATLRLGGVVVNVNPLYVERELRHLLDDSGAEIIATCDLTEVHARVSAVAAELGVRHVITCPIAEGLPTLQRIGYRLFKRRDIAPARHDARHITYHDLIAKRGEPAPVSVSPQSVAVLQYTGGTTGLPKAAMLTHANLVANADAMAIHVGGESPTQDRVLGVLPLFHVFALTTVLSISIRVGAEMILMPRFRLDDMLKTIARTRPTFFPAVPTIFGAVAAVAAKRPVDLSAIRACISG